MFTRGYHQHWSKEIRFLLTHIGQNPTVTRKEEVLLALAMLGHLIMPSGIDLVKLQRITSCDQSDIDALFLIMKLVPNLPYQFKIVDGIGFLVRP